VLLVVMFHCEVPGFGGGFIGVDVFFALSGYLITGLILNEIARTGKLSLRNFYARRARRLLPAAGLVVIGTLLLGLLFYSPLELVGFAKWASYTSLYVSNYMFVRDASNYFASDVATNPFLHTCSLALEEQFYLLWPALIMTALSVMKSRRRLAMLLMAMSTISLALCIWFTHHRQTLGIFRSTDSGLGVWVGWIGLHAARTEIGAKRTKMDEAARLGRVNSSFGGLLFLFLSDKIPQDCGVAACRGHDHNLGLRNVGSAVQFVNVAR
jgi:peptidoglycan/LPS O-acetylase OafA/YrhL